MGMTENDSANEFAEEMEKHRRRPEWQQKEVEKGIPEVSRVLREHPNGLKAQVVDKFLNEEVYSVYQTLYLMRAQGIAEFVYPDRIPVSKRGKLAKIWRLKKDA